MAGIIILSVVFFYFNVSYPSGPLNLSPPPVNTKNITKTPLGYLFKPQYLEPKGMQNLSFGTGPSDVMNFSLQKNGTTIITGQLMNKSSGSPISLSTLYVFAAPIYTVSSVGLNGSYKITVLILGSMNLTFAVPGYRKVVVHLDLQGGTYAMDLSLVPEKKYMWNGTTRSTSGASVGNVRVEANGFLDGTTVFSTGQNGHFSIPLFEDSYQITAIVSGYNSIPSPREVGITGPLYKNLTLTPKSNLMNITGYVLSKVNHKPVSSARVFNQQTNQYAFSNSKGYYTIGVISGLNRLFTTHSGYYVNLSYFNDTGTFFGTPIHNIYMEPLNPFLGNSTGYYGNSTGTPGLSNNSSSLNQNQTGNHLLTGKILVQGTSLPVANTELLFLINVNGSVYADTVITNSTGYYKTYFFYGGHYSIMVESVLYSNKLVSVSVSGPVTYYNFTLVPLKNKTVHIAGYVKNSRDLLPVANASVTAVYMKNQLIAGSVYTGQNGYFTMPLITGNYTFVASAYGYKTNTTGTIDLTSNTSITIYLTPVKSLPVGSRPCLNATGVSPSFGLPDLSPAQINRDLSGSGSITAQTMYRVTFHFNDSFKQSISNTQYVVYFKIFGQVYYTKGFTNSTGYGNLSCINAGNYEILPEMFYYRGSVENISVNSNTTLWFSMNRLSSFTGTFYLQNSFNLSRSLPGNVPNGPLALTDSILTIQVYATHLINSTEFTFSGYSGTFNFTYSNVHFLHSSFSLAINGRSKSMSVGLTPYEIIINGNAATTWQYSISGIGINVGAPSGLSVHYYLARLGLFNVTAGISGFPSIDYRIVSLSGSGPIRNVYFNQTTGESNFSLSGTSLAGSDFQMDYSGYVPANSIIFRGLIPYSIPSNSSIYFNNSRQSVNLVQGNNQTAFTLNSYYMASLKLNVKVDIPPNSNGKFIFSNGNLVIYYYQVSLT